MSLKWKKITNHLRGGGVGEGDRGPEQQDSALEKQALIYWRVLHVVELVRPCRIAGSVYLLYNLDSANTFSKEKIEN